MAFLGIDYGSKRVGIAYSDETGKVAFPLAILPNNKSLLPSVVGIIADKKIEKIILGESNNLDGTPNAIMKDIEIFKKNLSEATGIEIHFEPEFWTSFQAERWQGKTELVDASAAAIILQSFLDRNIK
ncbi:MAG: Holliday junction resolvase RuvX [Patescibacteria group bacterium]